MQSAAVSYRVDTLPAARKLLHIVAEEYPHRRQQGLEQGTTYYDTFDWRLFRRGLRLLERSHGQYQTLHLEPAEENEGKRALLEARPAFIWDLPPGPLRAGLEPIARMRRLLPVVTVSSRIESLNILDERQKTVARVQLRRSTACPERGDGDSNTLPVAIDLLPVRGYDEPYRSVRSLLEQYGCVASEEDEYTLATRAVDIDPGAHSRRLELKLEPSMPAEEAIRTILRRLLQILHLNEPGLRQNLDSEFLHDFRVAVRRTRSALSQLGGVFPVRFVDHFKTEFSWLGRVTGPTRDLDVYQLQMPLYRQSLPESSRADLDPLAEFIESHRQAEHAKLLDSLDSGRYRRLLSDWQEFLSGEVEAENPETGGEATVPIRDLASRVTWGSCRKVLRKGRNIRPESPAEDLHRLRIQCKKLRYLLEFFRSLYPQHEIVPLIRSLRQLQDNLGTFNDLEVQQTALRSYAESMLADGLATAPSIMAMGRLIEQLEQRQEEEHRAFHDRFAAFSKRKNRQRMRRLFRPREAASE